MAEVTFKIVGTTGLMMHNARLANPLDPIAKEIKKITAKRKKTDDDYAELSRLEFVGGLYHDADLGPYIPSQNLEASIREAARLSKRGKDAERAILVLEHAKLEYKGPRDPKAMWEKQTFHDVRRVSGRGKGGGSSTMRTRPIFNEWSCEFTVIFKEDMINRDEIIEFVNTAGDVTGLLDNRPRYGRFTVESVK